MLAELEGKVWEGHGKTQLTCCTDQASASNRLKVILVRNPLSKLISSFMHPKLCSRWCSATFDDSCLENFTRWFDELDKKAPIDTKDTGNHFKNQAGHFIDPRLKEPYNAGDFFVVHLESTERDLAILSKVLRRCLKFFSSLPRLSVENTSRKLQNFTQHMQVLASCPELLQRIRERYTADFKLFGYSDDGIREQPVSLSNHIPILSTNDALNVHIGQIVEFKLAKLENKE